MSNYFQTINDDAEVLANKHSLQELYEMEKKPNLGEYDSLMISVAIIIHHERNKTAP